MFSATILVLLAAAAAPAQSRRPVLAGPQDIEFTFANVSARLDQAN